MSRIRLIHHVNVPISNRERTREYHPLGIGDSRGNKVEVMPGGLCWSPRPGLVAAGDRGERR
jgi:hypothetical protein